MSERTKKLLAVLDLPEEQHIVKLLELGAITSDEYDNVEAGRVEANMLLADLAFRLRDEVVKHFEEWRNAVVDVASYALGVDWENYWDYAEAIIWFIRYGQPIHWIVASLIAKELTK